MTKVSVPPKNGKSIAAKRLRKGAIGKIRGRKGGPPGELGGSCPVTAGFRRPTARGGVLNGRSPDAHPQVAKTGRLGYAGRGRGPHNKAAASPAGHRTEPLSDALTN